MTSGAIEEFQPVILRKATLTDLDAVKSIFDHHKFELGFVVRTALEKSIHLEEIIIAEAKEGRLVGVVHYHHRRDAQTTLYSIVVDSAWRGQRVGYSLVNALRDECCVKGQQFILLKCPQDLPANHFYPKCGYTRTGIETGKHRSLNIWTLRTVCDE